MTIFELIYSAIRVFLPYHASRTNQDLRKIVREQKGTVQLLDIGARKSHYTIGLNANITLLDVPRESTVQHHMNLGTNDQIIEGIKKRRSNITNYVIENFINNSLPDGAFDVITAIEVLEHVTDDNAFLAQVDRLLKPTGVFYMTTPNGTTVKNTNPDHVRHYSGEALESIMKRYFARVVIQYAEVLSPLRRYGFGLLESRRPTKLIVGATSNAMYRLECAIRRSTEYNSARLLATAHKSSSSR